MAGIIAPGFEQTELQRGRRKPTCSLKAYDHYLRATAALHKWERQANSDALANLYRAIDLDPEFAAAYGLAARCFVQRRACAWVVDRQRDIAEATRLAGCAIDLGNDDAMALCTAGFALAEVADKVEEGDAYIDRAIALEPDLATAWVFSGWTKISLGDADTAIQRLGHAMRQSPRDPLLCTMQAAMSCAHFIARRYADAFSWAELAMRGKPLLISMCVAAASAALAGREAEATRRMLQLREAAPKLRLSNVDDVMSFHTEIKGFGLLVLPTGVRSYFYRYRTPEGRERRATIGKHGSVTPDEARNAADDMRQAVRAGRDPLGEKRERKLAPTVAEVLNAYLASDRFRAKAPSTQAIDRGRIERHLKPLLGRKHVHTLTPGDIEGAFAAIRDGKTATDVKTRRRGRARVRGGEGTARMAIELLRAAFTWAVGERIAKSNPCKDIKTGSSGSRDTIMRDAADYARLFQTLERMQQEKRLRVQVADAIGVIALTGARRGEIAGLRWEHVDLKRGLLSLPPKAHKTGRRTGKPQVIGLPAAAQAIIARQPEGAAGDYVFVPSHGDGPIALSKLWRIVRLEAKLPEGIGLHGLRHSLASHMAMNGAAAGEIMTALGHRQLSTAQRYVHWAQDARQALAERAAKVALAGMAASSDNSAAEVVGLTKARER